MVLYEANPPGQQFLHHALLEGAGLVAAGFEGGEFGVYVGEDGGDGGLFFDLCGARCAIRSGDWAMPSAAFT